MYKKQYVIYQIYASAAAEKEKSARFQVYEVEKIFNITIFKTYLTSFYKLEDAQYYINGLRHYPKVVQKWVMEE